MDKLSMVGNSLDSDAVTRMCCCLDGCLIFVVITIPHKILAGVWTVFSIVAGKACLL